MRGRLLILGAASASPRVALVYFGQGNAGRGSATSDWLAETSDGGRTWRVARATANLNTFAFAGTDGWAEGLRSDGHGDGGVASWFATHDGARTWHVAASDDPAPGGGSNVSIAGGEVWSLGGRCTGNACTDAMLKAPASADHLSDTPGQPALGDTTNVSIVATGRDQAYVLADDYRTVRHVSEIVRTRLFATHDGGRTWRRMPAPCPRRTFGRIFGGGTALWATCAPMHGATEMWRSTDGAAHWTVLPSTLGYAWSLEPASAQVAWAVAAGGRVLRTADGGQTWQQVWYGGRPEPAPLAGNTPVLTAQSPTTATVIAVVTRGHVDGHAARTDFVTYRTTDGGRIWSPSVVRLPAG